ncbi:RdRP-domain-containing protein [Calocera viscosa TUFC12733]|uniref:RNA-dependent RNA polymerase n=1 Tax=Calocera viscosa (strain TUFC12733) TaxID=1330018 RepID=A0A167G936_CALVF|nr:RdRP-domain-containing protein [Calocera viscosa TUFC12733]
MRSQVPAPLLDILGTRESLVPCPASISSDYNASSARNPPSPTGTPQNAQSPENELNNELKQQGKRARSTDMDSGYPYKRSKVQTPTPGIEEQPAVLPSIIPSSERSSFLPPSMLRRSPSSSLHRGPLAPVQASVQLQQELIGLPFHVAYEVFRLANSFLSVEEILAQHKQLQALHKACDVLDSGSKHGGIVKVINCLADLLPREKRHTFVVKTKVWQTLADEKALQGKGDSLELGNPNEMKDHRFGGRVRFRAVLSVAKDAGSKLSSRPSKQPRLTVELKAPTVTVGNSNRLTRLYGSDAFLCVKIDDPSMKRVDPAYLRESLCEGILLGNDLYHAWFIKDGTALFINTAIRNKILSISHLDSDEFFIWFIDRHNPPGLNQRQTVGKWAKRMQLLWSSSVPGPRLDAADIQPEEDKIAPSYRHLAKPPAEGDMTDGAGLMTWAVARDIQARLGLRFAPCALQVRLAGKKGMVSRCPPSMDVDGVRRVWVRPSQGKIKYGEDQLQDPSLCTIDVLSPSSFSAPARITTQLVVLLAENGVPNTVLVDLMVKSLKTSLQPFFEKESKPLHMACALEDLCHLMVQRLSKAGSLLRGASVEEISEDDDEFEDHPGSYEESAYLCFLSGFALKGSAYLRRKVRDVIKKLIQCTTNDIRFKLERYPTGKLAPGEIFVQFRREYDVNTIESVKILTGDVLITRHPCKLPTDIQKMRAVDIDELHYMYDVIVMSTQGERSPASMLGGGDYDGDRATVVWEPQLVEPFKNADPGFADQPKDFESFLDRDLTTVASLIDETRTWGAQAKRLQIQKYLLSDLNSDFQMQGYSTRHDVALYLLGASHPKAVEFAHKYMVSLDSSKTGVKVKASVYASKEDREYDRQHPWKPQDEKSAHKFALGPRPAHLGRFVLDDFKTQAKRVEAKLLSKYDLLYSPKMENGVHVSRDFPLDKDLRGPWEEFERRQGEKLDIVRRAIMAHVKEAYYKYKAMNQEYARAQDAGIALTRTRTDRIKEVRQFYRSGPRESTWKGVMSADECAVYKASYCYLWDMQQEGNKRGDFPFEVDHWTICSIKARANSTGAVAITTSAYKVLRVDSRLLSTTTNIDYDNE